MFGLFIFISRLITAAEEVVLWSSFVSLQCDTEMTGGDGAAMEE